MAVKARGAGVSLGRARAQQAHLSYQGLQAEAALAARNLRQHEASVKVPPQYLGCRVWL